MIINKVTVGFVIQQFDTETQKYVNQSFVAGDVTYEDAQGEELSDYQLTNAAKANFGPYAEQEPYLPFDMQQPIDME